MDIPASESLWAGIDIGRHLFWFSPELALICTMLAIVAAPLVLGRSARTIGAVASIGIVVSLILVVRVASLLSAADAEPVSGFSPNPASGMLIADNLATFYKFVLILFLAGVTYLWWLGSAEQERDAPEFFILLIGSALGMALMVSTSNLLMIVVAIEMASLPSYAIVGINKRDAKSAEASLKYMIFGAISAAAMVYGVSLLYGLTGSLDLGVVAGEVFNGLVGGNRFMIGVASFCLLAGIGFKISAVPFHFWCPDAFEGAKIEVTTWLSVASKAAGLVLLLRVCGTLCAAVDVPESMDVIQPVAWVIGIMAMITCTWANFAAYHQTSVKRLLAYSSIAHAGYMLMAVTVFIHSEKLLVDPDFPLMGTTANPAASALLAYIFIYLFMNLGAFGVVALVNWQTGSDDIDQFTGLTRRAPWLAVPMIICLVSLIGLPPLAGFIGKWWILIALGQQGTILGWVLVVVAVVNTLISLYYYLRVVVQMSLRDDGRPAFTPPVGGMALVNACAVALLALFLLVGPLKDTTDRFSRNAFNPYKITGTIPASADGLADAAGMK